MKIRYLADLHLEFRDYKPRILRSIGEDLVVLAGDIGTGLGGIQWAKSAIADRPVIYVLGNHEFYGRDFVALVDDARAFCRGSHVHVLENDAVVIDRVRFLGCSLWTNFRLPGFAPREAMAVAEDCMNDYRLIGHERTYLRAAATVARCEQSLAWLSEQIPASEQATVVVTHHAPTLHTLHPSFLGQPTNAAFHNDRPELLRAPVRLWIHGHTHFSTSALVNCIPVVTNQFGYPGEGCAFDWDALVEIDSREETRP